MQGDRAWAAKDRRSLNVLQVRLFGWFGRPNRTQEVAGSIPAGSTSRTEPVAVLGKRTGRLDLPPSSWPWWSRQDEREFGRALAEDRVARLQELFKRLHRRQPGHRQLGARDRTTTSRVVGRLAIISSGHDRLVGGSSI